MLYLIRYLSLRHAWTHKTRTLLTLTGVALGVAVVIAIQTVNHSILESFRRMLDSVAGRATLQVAAGANGVPENLWETLEKAPHVRYVAPVVQQIVKVPEFENATVLILGIDFTGDEEFRDYRISEEENKVDDPLAFLNDPTALLISEELANHYHRKVGDSIRVRAPDGDRTLKIRGLLKAEGPARAFGGNFMVMDIFAAQALLGREGKFDRFDVITSGDIKVRDVQTELTKYLGNAYRVEVPRARGDNAQNMLASFQLGLNMGAFVALLVALFLIYNTMQISVTQRRREISIAKALGAKRSDIIKLFMGEALLLGIVASFVGLGFGLWMARGLLGTVSGAVSMHFLKVHPDQIYLSTKILIFGFLAGVGSACLASIGPANMAASITPVEGLRFEGNQTSFQPTWTTLNAKVGYLLGVIALTLTYLTPKLPSLYWGYAAQLCSALTFAFLAPTLLVTFWRLARPFAHRFLKPPERLAFDQLPRQAARAAVTLSAIMLGFAMVVEIDNYIFSLKRTLQHWVVQSIPADIFVASGAKLARMDNRPMREDLEKTFQSWPEVDAVDKFRATDVEIEGVTVPLLSNLPEVYLSHVKRKFLQGVVADAATRLTHEKTILVADNFVRRFGRKLGDSISIQTPQGPVDFKIIGVIEDYTSDRGAIMMSRTQFGKAFNDTLVDSFDLYLKDKSQVEMVRKRILDSMSSDLELFALTNQEMRSEIYRIIDETYKVIKVLEIIAVLVSILGIVNTILASVLERTRMLGVLRALGATRTQISRMVMAEGGYLAFGGICLGFILGVIMTHIIFIGILPKATGWTFSLYVPVVRIILVASTGLILSILAAYLPARHAGKLNIVKAIEYE